MGKPKLDKGDVVAMIIFAVFALVAAGLFIGLLARQDYSDTGVTIIVSFALVAFVGFIVMALSRKN